MSRNPLNFPGYASQFVTDVDGSCPNLVEDPRYDPTLKDAVHRAVVRKPVGQILPLAAAAHPVDIASSAARWSMRLRPVCCG
jgi:hypothetical protein